MTSALGNSTEALLLAQIQATKASMAHRMDQRRLQPSTLVTTLPIPGPATVTLGNPSPMLLLSKGLTHHRVVAPQPSVVMLPSLMMARHQARSRLHRSLVAQPAIRQVPAPVPRKPSMPPEAILDLLGNKQRQPSDSYVDILRVVPPQVMAQLPIPKRGGTSESFPRKVHRMLSDVESHGWQDICSFSPDGKEFIVHDTERIVNEVLPHYCRQTKWDSFKRQLNLYGFCRKEKGNTFFHVLFRKGHPHYCAHMRRVGGK